MADRDNSLPWNIFGSRRSIFEEPTGPNNPPRLDRNPWEIANENLNPTPRERRPLTSEQFQERHPNRLDRILAGARYIGQGVPIFGGMLNETTGSRDFGRTYPMSGGLGRFMAGVAGYSPMAGTVRAGTAAMGNIIRGIMGSSRVRSNPHLISDVVGQGLLGGTVATADTAVRHGPNESFPTFNELFNNGALGAASGVAGTLLGRAWAPSGVGQRLRYNPRYSPPVRTAPEDTGLIAHLSRDPNFRTILEAEVRRSRAAGRQIQIPESLRYANRTRGRMLADTTADTLGAWAPRLTGALVGHMSGGLPGILQGAVAGEAARIAARAYSRSRMGQTHLGRQVTPNTQAILDALGPSALLNYDQERLAPTNPDEDLARFRF